MKILNREEVEQIEEIVEKNYGIKIDLNQFLVLKTFEDKIWLTTKDILNLDLSTLPINSIGMNFGKLKRNDKINLTVEGSQMVGINANKNIVFLNKENYEKFMGGSNVKPEREINCEQHNFVLVKFGGDVLGSSLLTEDVIKNLLPKSRRILI
jgi:NOL1/NOP2/fmu family ribosome biogenesis protein